MPAQLKVAAPRNQYLSRISLEMDVVRMGAIQGGQLAAVRALQGMASSLILQKGPGKSKNGSRTTLPFAL
jgi:hypothetical protein